MKYLGHYANGRPNGYFRKINSDGDIDLFACFVHGSLHGNCWKGMLMPISGLLCKKVLI